MEAIAIDHQDYVETVLSFCECLAHDVIIKTGYRDAAILTKINPLALVPIHINQSTLTASVDADDNSILERIGNFLVSQLQTEYESKKQKIRGQDGIFG